MHGTRDFSTLTEFEILGDKTLGSRILQGGKRGRSTSTTELSQLVGAVPTLLPSKRRRCAFHSVAEAMVVRTYHTMPYELQRISDSECNDEGAK